MERKMIQSKSYPLFLEKDIGQDLILDIGGGGEGIIGKLYGPCVLAIDSRKEELEETNNDALKLVMNASEMGFLDDSFHACTAFYTFMYMKKTTRKKTIQEIYRVLKKDGVFYIWDTKIPAMDGVDEAIYLNHLEIHMPITQEVIKTTYGIKLSEEGLEVDSLINNLDRVGFKEIQVTKDREHFKIVCRK